MMKHAFLKATFLSGALLFTPVLDKVFAQTSGNAPGGNDQTELVDKKIGKTGGFDESALQARLNSEPNPEDGTSVLTIDVATPSDQKAQVEKDAQELLDNIAALPVEEPIPAAVFIYIQDDLTIPMGGACIFGERFRVKDAQGKGQSAFSFQVMKDNPGVLATAYLRKKEEVKK